MNINIMLFLGYNDAIFCNMFSLVKNWYMENGSIIRYILTNNFVNENDDTYEQCLICLGVYITEFDRFYKFKELDKELFKQFMTNKITINEVLEQGKEKAKKLK